MADATKNPWYNALPFDYKELPPWMFGNTVMEPAAEMANLQAQELANAQRKITLEEAQQNEQARDAIAEALQAQDSFTYEQALPIMQQKFLEYGITDPAIKAAEEQARIKKDTQANQRGIITQAVQLDNMMPGMGRALLRQAAEAGEVTLPPDFDWDQMKAFFHTLTGGGAGEYYPETHEFKTLREPVTGSKPQIRNRPRGEIVKVDPITGDVTVLTKGEEGPTEPWVNPNDLNDFVLVPKGKQGPKDKQPLSVYNANLRRLDAMWYQGGAAPPPTQVGNPTPAPTPTPIPKIAKSKYSQMPPPLPEEANDPQAYVRRIKKMEEMGTIPKSGK